MHRKNIGVVVNSSFALMRTSRFLSRLCRDDHSSLYSNSISSLSSSSSKLISYTSDSPKEQQKNKIADSHRRLQFNSPHRLTRGGGQGFFSSPWRSFLYSVNSSPHVISLPSFSLDSSSIRHSFNRGKFFDYIIDLFSNVVVYFDSFLFFKKIFFPRFQVF